MLELKTRSLLLREINREDLEILHRWRNDDSFLKFCTLHNKPLTLKEFEEELNEDFQNDRHIQMLILGGKEHMAVGTIYSYNFSEVDEHAFISIFIEPKYTQTGIGVKSMALFILYLLEHFGLYKLYMDVYENNISSLSILNKGGFGLIKEGFFKKHRKMPNGNRVGIYRFAFYRTELKKLKKFNQKLN